MSQVVDDKSQHCIPFILDRLRAHREQYETRGEQPPPFFLGLNGVQGAGKTTLVSTLSETLSSSEYSLPTLVLSIDDLYLSHDRQEALANSQPQNPLVQHRGQPSTHDVKLGKELFNALSNREPNIRIPSYDKSAFGGTGDQRPQSKWASVNTPDTNSVEVIVFEGWCVGFRALEDEQVEEKWRSACEVFSRDPESYKGRLGRQLLDSVLFVNRSLRDYDALTDRFDAFIHIDTEDTLCVYNWRLEQEAAMRAAKGTGMTDEQVVNFVNGYYPAYELYTDTLRDGIFGGDEGKQLRLVVDKSRRVKDVFHI